MSPTTTSNCISMQTTNCFYDHQHSPISLPNLSLWPTKDSLSPCGRHNLAPKLNGRRRGWCPRRCSNYGISESTTTKCVAESAASSDDSLEIQKQQQGPVSLLGAEAEDSKGLLDQVPKIFVFAGPASKIWLFGPLMSIIDTNVVGSKGNSLELAALGPGTVFCDYSTFIFMFLWIATTNLIAPAFSQKILLVHSFNMDNTFAPRVVCYDSDYQTIQAFLDEWKPSLVPFDHVEWLTVSGAHVSHDDSLVDTHGLLAAWEALSLSTLDRLTTQDIERLAVSHNVLHGKWMIFANRAEVDEMRARIVVPMVNDGLAFDAKVSTSHVKLKTNGQPKEEKIPPGKHVICVWSDNFTNIEDVFALRGHLWDLGFTDTLAYKPDAYSICGVYQGNRLGLLATKFCA